MNTLYLLRHSLTEANERRLYGGSTDSPLTERGRALALARRGAVPPCDVCITSGMARASETLWLMTGREPDLVLPGLREMDFGEFEMQPYAVLKDIPEYIRWIEDDTGEVRCPGGENMNAFRARVLADGARLLALEQDTACVVCHGGTVVRLMSAWFPGEPRNFYEWQPAACGGWRVTFDGETPLGFDGL